MLLVPLWRVENEDLTLKELGELLNPPISKSGVNHRLKKIEDIANELRNIQHKNFFYILSLSLNLKS